MHISIIIPVYNSSGFIEDCISSVCKQTMADGVECVIVDDISPDNSMELAEKAISRYHGNIKFKVVRHTENKGVSSARNTGIRHAAGDYIFFLDSDDFMKPDCLEVLWGLVDKYPGVDIVRGNVRCLGKKGKFNIDKIPGLPEYSQDRTWLRDATQRGRVPQNVWNQLIRREFVIQYNLFFMDGIIFEDWHWWHFAGRHLRSMAFTKQFTYVYNDNPNSLISTHFTAKLDVRSLCVLTNDLVERIDKTAMRTEMLAILSCTYRMGKTTHIMGGNFFRFNPLYKKKYFRKLYDSYIYIDKYGRRSIKGIRAYLWFETCLWYTCQKLARQKL